MSKCFVRFNAPSSPLKPLLKSFPSCIEAYDFIELKGGLISNPSVVCNCKECVAARYEERMEARMQA